MHIYITTSYLYMFESENASTLCESVNIYLFPIIFVHLGTGAWSMDFVSSSPLFSTTPLFSKFSYKSFLFQNFRLEKLWTQNTRIIHDV